MQLGTYSNRINKPRRYLIAFLIMLSFVLTTGTFAYWMGNVEGTHIEAVDSITIGYGEAAETNIVITPNQLNNDSYLVPATQIENSIGNAVDQINLEYYLKWIEENNQSQVEGETIEGLITIDVTYDIYPYNSIDVLDKNEYASVYELVQLKGYDLNNYAIILNDSTSNKLGFEVTLIEPKDKTDYEIIQQSTIIFHLTFTVDLDIYDLNYTFVDMNKDDLRTLNTSFYLEDKWDTVVGSPLVFDTGEARIYFPISEDEYTITVQAQLEDGSNGGYGILFDTILNNDDPHYDSGYAFQFDRGYAGGQMIVRERIFGGEKNPSWTRDNGADYFPSYEDNSDWWSSLHEIIIEVSRIDEQTKEARFYIDDIYLGSMTYDAHDLETQTYVGFRGWGGYSTNFYSISVK